MDVTWNTVRLCDEEFLKNKANAAEVRDALAPQRLPARARATCGIWQAAMVTPFEDVR